MTYLTSTLFYKITTLIFVLSLLIKVSSIRPINSYGYSLFSPSVQVLERFELHVIRNLTHAFLATEKLKTGSDLYNTVHSYLKDFYESSENTHLNDALSKDEAHASQDPICTYRLLRRIIFQLKNLVFHRNFPQKFGLLSWKILTFFGRNDWPTTEDVDLIIEKILRIQLVYNIHVEQLSNSSVTPGHTSCTLNSVHCYDIAKTAIKTEQYTSAIEWLEIAKEKALLDKKASIPFIEFSLTKTIQMHNLDFVAGSKMKLEPTFFNRKIRHISQDSRRAQKLRNIQFDAFKGRRENQYANINYWGLCSGANFQTDVEKSSLFCWYEFQAQPLYMIGPIKVEFLARNPDMVQIYGIFNEKEIKHVKGNSFPKTNLLSNSGKAERMVNVRLSASKIRTSVKTTYNASGASSLSLKIKQLTGRKWFSNTSEFLEIESYSSGGHGLPRLDERRTSRTFQGHATATLLIYLNDVEQGGYTAFTSLGVAVKPVKGSAILWHNVYVDGAVDLETIRGECPVLRGEKWTASKMLSLGIFTTKCGPNPNERFRIPVNNRFLPAPTITLAKDEALSLFDEALDTRKYLGRYSFPTPHGQKALLQLEWKIYTHIQYLYHKYRNLTKGTFREEFENKNHAVIMYLKDFEESYRIENLEHSISHLMQRAEDAPLNPLASYKIVARFLDYLKPWFGQIQSAKNKLMSEITSSLRNTFDARNMPQQEDLESGMTTILKIQHTHDLVVNDVANGCMVGICTGVALNARDCFSIGKHGVFLKLFTSGIEWLEHALHLVQNTSDISVKYEDVYDELATGEIIHDEEHAKAKPNHYNVFNEPLIKASQGSQRVARKSIMKQRALEIGDNKHLDVRLWDICKGNTYMTATNKSKLFCWYEREIHPSFKIGPIKAELHSVYPIMEVVQYYDLLSDTAIDEIKNLSYPYFKCNPANDDLSPPKDPLGSSLCAADVNEVMAKGSLAVMKAIKLATKLTGYKATDELTVFGLAPGSSRGRHLDVSENDLITFLFYLSDVEKGGETAFILDGVAVAPKKGSGIFWHNLYSSGAGIGISKHAACPVIFGEKWTAAPMILYHNQDHLQCHLQPNLPHEVLVNRVSKYA